MRLTVLLFAGLVESIGSRSLEIELADESTVADLLRSLAERHAAIAALGGRLAVAIDERYAKADTVIRAGQTVALIPPVSGG